MQLKKPKLSGPYSPRGCIEYIITSSHLDKLLLIYNAIECEGENIHPIKKQQRREDCSLKQQFLSLGVQ